MSSLTKATITLKLSNGFVQDYNKTQYLKEHNPEYNKTYDTIAYNLELEKDNY